MTFELQIVTPDGLIFEGEAEKLFCRTIAGDVCILARHCDYMTALGMGEARVTMADGTVRRAACIGGMLAVTDLPDLFRALREKGVRLSGD